LSPLTWQPLVPPFWPFPIVKPFETLLSIASLLDFRSIVRLRSWIGFKMR
jgi:hypothetical protein